MRKTEEIILHDGGNKLTFKITQMAATKMERWLNRVVMLLAKGSVKAFSGLTIPMNVADKKELEKFFFLAIKDKGIDGILKMIGSIDYEEMEPLYEELLGCCARVEGAYEQTCTKENIDNFISEVKNLYLLRWAVLKLNFDFFSAAGNSPITPAAQADIKILRNTPTSAAK